MNKTTEALKLAEEALSTLLIEKGSIYQKALVAIREALAECKPAPDGRIPKTVFTLEDIGKAFEDGRKSMQCEMEALAEQDHFSASGKPIAEPMKQEPVAWRNAIKHWAFDCAWDDLSERQIDDLELLITGILNAAPVDAKAIRAEAREERTNELMQLFLDPENQPTQFGTATLEYREEESKAIRAEALEEAAKVCDDESRYSNDAECCAAVIRGLK